MAQRSWPFAAAIAFAALAAGWILTRPAPLTLGGDNEVLRHPLLVDAFRQLSAGRLPLWTAGRWGGSPLIGDADLGALYAPYYLGYALTSFPHWRALDVAACLHLASLLAGSVWLLGLLGARPAVAFTGAVLLALEPTLVFIVRNWAEYWAALSYWPWLFGAALRLATRPSVGAALLATLTLALQVYAGYPQFALYSGGAALLGSVLLPGPPRGQRAWSAILVTGAALGLAAPQILTGLAMARESIRWGPESALAMRALAAFVLPPAGWAEVVRATPIAAITPCKIAPAVLVLAVIGGAESAAPRFLALVAVAAIVLATGSTPLDRALHAVPPFSLFGAPVKFFYLAAFLAAVLAGVGLERILGATDRVRRLALVVLVGVALPALGATLPPAGVVVLGGAVLVLVLLPGWLVGAASVAVALGGSVAFLVATRALVSPPVWHGGAFQPLLAGSPADAGSPAREARYLALAVDGSLHQVGLNYGALWGVESLNGVGPLVQWRQLQVLERARPEDAAQLVRELRADPVIVVAGTRLEVDLERAGFRGPPAAAGLRRLSSPEAPLPRYQLVADARPASSTEAIEAARAGAALDAHTVLIEAAGLEGGAAGDPHGRVVVLARRPGFARLRVAVDRPTWLVAREPFYRNWRATVDGAAATIRPAGGFFLALLVDAGDHDVELVYREPGLATGAAVAVLVAIGLSGLAWRSTGRSSRRKFILALG